MAKNQPATISTTSAEHRQLVALLFTDLVGSTQLKQDLGDREGLALIQRHHALLRETLHAFRDGQKISTVGNSFSLVFGNPWMPCASRYGCMPGCVR